MVTDVISLIDKLRNWNRDVRKDKRELFQTLIEPAFLDLAAIHTDYLKTFQRVLEEYSRTPRPPGFFKEEIVERKVELEHLRVKVRELSKAINNSKKIPKTAKNFFQECYAYFSTASGQVWGGPPGSGITSHYSDLLSFMNEESIKKEGGGMPWRQDLDTFGCTLYSLLAKLRGRWEKITEAYAICRIDLL